MTIDEARLTITSAIQTIYDGDEANNIAALLIEHITNLPLTERIMKKNDVLPSKQEVLLKQSVMRLEEHEPIQYVINEAWFAGMKFYVDKHVLIPRPETEELVDWIVSDWRLDNNKGTIGKRQEASFKSQSRWHSGNSKLLDVGTGSGCIAIALKVALPNIEMWACDVSDEALNVARLNADSLHATIDFVPMNFLDADERKQLPRVDLLVSNPPYVPQRENAEIKKNVNEFEPPPALFVPDDDVMIFYKAIADFGREKLNDEGCIYVEIHESFGPEVKKVFQCNGYSTVELRKDLQGKDRMVKVTLP